MRKFILTALVCCSLALQAQYKSPFFNTLTVDDGLPEANIQTAVEDKYGYLWLGTQNGLVRYDGYRLKPYPILNDDGRPVNPAAIRHLLEDSKGKLWAFVYLEGIYWYDRTKDAFVKSPVNKEAEVQLKKITVNFCKEDKKNNCLWISAFDTEKNKNALYSFDLTSNKLVAYSDMASGNNFIPSYATLDFSLDAAGKLWVITDSLLSFFEPATKSFKPYFVLPDISDNARIIGVLADPMDADMLWLNISRGIPTALEPKNVRKILMVNTKTKAYKISTTNSKDPSALPDNCFHTFVDSLKRVWLSTDQGLSLYNRQTMTFTSYKLNYTEKLSHTEVLTSDKDGNLWVAGNVGGLFFIDTKSGIAHLCKPNEGPGSLPTFRFVNKIFFDRSGTLWVNMPFQGIAWRHRQKTQFTPLAVNPFPQSSSIKEMPPQYAMIGTEGDSICYLIDTTSLLAWNTLKNTFEKIDLKDKLLYKKVIGVTKSKDGNLWLAGLESGLMQYNPVSKTINKFLHNPKDSSSVNGMAIVSVLADKDRTVWVGSADMGLSSYDLQTKKFTRYPFASNNGTRQVKDSLDDRTAGYLYMDRDSILWIGTNNGGVNSFNPKTKKFRSYMNYKEGFFSVTSMLEDSRKRFWVGTYLSGVYLLDRQTGSFQRFSEKEGLIHNSVFSLKEDAAGNIWAATTKGMSRINPATKSITNFAAAKAVEYEFVINNLYDRNGVFHLPGRNGILAFNPLQLDESKTQPVVLIESVGYRAAGNKYDTLLFTEGLDKIRLKFNENRISFQYVALHFADASQNQYAYQLEGYDKEWVLAGTQRSVTYTNLPAGKYIFKVKAANNDGLWNETGASIVIIISPPWWKTWWAYCLYALLIGGIIWTYIQYRSKALRRENLLLEHKVEHRTKQLQESIESLKATQTQLIQSEKMASLGELTAGIAHEIQNPLNFVNNFSEVNTELIDEMKEELKAGNTTDAIALADDIKANNEKIAFHGKRADSIVKGMLQHSRSGSSQKEPTDINNLLDECLRLSFHGMRAKDKSFNAKMDTSFESSLGPINIVSQEIGRVFLNLFTNAFYSVMQKRKNAGDSFDPVVSASTQKEGNTIKIIVRDNGNGIPQKVIDKIFQPFFTTKPTGEGTGLGLSMSYDIITKGHSGELKVETKEGEFAQFTIILPA